MFKKGDIVLCAGTPSDAFKAKHWHSVLYTPRPDEPCCVDSINEENNHAWVKAVSLNSYRPCELCASWPLDLLQQAHAIQQMEYRLKMLEMRMYHIEYPAED